MNIHEGRTKFKYYDKYGNFDKAFTDEVWDNIMDVNAKGTFLVNKAAVIQMRAQGGGGRIINISSVAGKFGTATLTHYCASKGVVTHIIDQFQPYCDTLHTNSSGVRGGRPSGSDFFVKKSINRI